MDEEYGTYPKTAWFNFPCGQIKLSLSNNYYQESRTSPEVKVFFAPENPDPVGFSYGLEVRLKRGSFEYSFNNRKVLLDPGHRGGGHSASRRSRFMTSRPAGPSPENRPCSAIQSPRKGSPSWSMFRGTASDRRVSWQPRRNGLLPPQGILGKEDAAIDVVFV